MFVEEAISFILGVLLGEILTRPSRNDVLREFFSFIILISLSAYLFSNTYYLLGTSKQILCLYSFTVGFSSDVISRILTFTATFKYGEKRGRIREIYLRNVVRTILSMKKAGLRDKDIERIMRKIGVEMRIVRKVLDFLKREITYAFQKNS